MHVQQQQHGQMQQLVPAAVAIGRGALVGWLRCVLDLLAGLTLVDPGAVLNELSHKLAGEARLVLTLFVHHTCAFVNRQLACLF